MIQWTSPFMLAGLGLLSLPVIAHLLSRRARRSYAISSTRFLEEAMSERNHLLKLKRWILMLLRCLAVAMVVLAFARPIWQSPMKLPSGEGSLAMVIVLDTSVSTSQMQGNTHAFQHFLASAERSLAQLKSGTDVANIIIAESIASPLIPELTKNLPLLKNQLQKLNWKYDRADLSGALTEAIKQFEGHAGRKLLIIISDMQATNWRELSDETVRSIRIPKGVETKIIEFNPDSIANISLVNPQSIPADPLPGQSVQLSVEVHSDAKAITQVPITLSITGGESMIQQVQVAPESAAVVSFDVTFDSSLDGSFVFSIPDDRLAADNQAFYALRTGITTPVVVIADDPPDEAGTSAFFMERALLPFNSKKDRFKLTLLDSKEVVSESLKRYQIAIVGYVTGLSEEANQELVRFVSNGGKVLYLCGEGDVGPQLQRLDQAADQRLLPFRLGTLDRYTRFEQAPFIAAGKWRSRWLQAFDVPSQIALRQIRFPKVWSVESVAADAEILLTYSDERPALAVRHYGEGQFLLANLSPSLEFSDFGTYGSFAALIQMLVSQLREMATNEPLIVNKSLTFSTVAATKDDGQVNIIRPDGKVLLKYELLDSTPEVLYIDDVSLPGFYRLESGRQILQTIAVNIDPRESDLRMIDPQRIEFLEDSTFHVESLSEFGEGIVERGLPLWGWLALLGLIALTTESFLVGWWRR